MRSFPVFYRTDEARSIKPFIIAPVGDLQTTFAVAPKELAKKEGQLLQEIFSKEFDSTKPPFVRVFAFEEQYIVSITFSSDIVEKGSGRKGLFFTIGVSIDESFLKDNGAPKISLFLKTFIILFHSIGIDLYTRDGCNKIVSDFQNSENYEFLSLKTEEYVRLIYDSLKNYRSPLFLKMITRIKFFLRWRHSSLRVVRCSEKLKERDFVETSLDEIDEFFLFNKIKDIAFICAKGYESDF